MTLRDDSTPGVRVDKVRKTSLDKDLRKIERLEEATRAVSRNRLALGIAVLFLATAGVLASSQIGASQNAVLMVVAAVIGGYMALTIGANDVANNVGPAVGARALTMTGALVIAAIFECAGALIAGGDVVQTISKDIIDPALVGSSDVFVWVVISAARFRAMGASGHVSRRARLDDPRHLRRCARRRGYGGWRRCCRLVRGDLDLCELADVSAYWRCHSGRRAHLHQGQPHLPGGQDRRRAALGARLGGAYGRDLRGLSRGQGLEPCVDARTARGHDDQRLGVRSRLSGGQALGCAVSPKAWRTATRLCASCSICR